MQTDQVVLLDTSAYSALFVTPAETARRQGHPVERWQAAIRGRRVVIAFQTRAEALVGARSARWGEPRLRALTERLDATPTVQLDADVLDAYVTLTVQARALGMAISQKSHIADRWIAACAIAKSIPLLTGDSIFTAAPSLSLMEPGSSQA